MKKYRDFEYYEKISDIPQNDGEEKVTCVPIIDTRVDSNGKNVIYTNIELEDISSHSDDENYYDDKVKIYIDDRFYSRPLEKVYVTNFSLSYSQYLKGQNKSAITEEESNILINSLVKYYKNEASVNDVIQFFEIPESGIEKIAARQYDISVELVADQSDYQILLAKYTLTFNDDVVAEDVVNNGQSSAEELVRNTINDLQKKIDEESGIIDVPCKEID